MLNPVRLLAALPAKRFVFGYLALYALMLFLLARYEHFGLAEPLFVVGSIGITFTFVGWLVTCHCPPVRVKVNRPVAEALAIIVYLVVFAFGFLGWGLSALKADLPDPRLHMLAVTAAKLLMMVILPLLLLRAFGYPVKEFLRWNLNLRKLGLPLLVMVALVVAFQLLFGQALPRLHALHPSISTLLFYLPICFVYQALDAGLMEEFLFRVVIQTRFAALFRSETAGVIVMSLLFGLAHAPGYYLRAADTSVGTHPSVLMAAGYGVVMISVFGFMFGLLWARTRSLGFVVLLHGAADWLPNLADFIQTWSHKLAHLQVLG